MKRVTDNEPRLTMKRDPLFVLSANSLDHPVTMACDADLANCKQTCRSRTGFVVLLFGNLMDWCSQKQRSVSLSVAESEYVAMSTAAQFGIWYNALLSDMGLELAMHRSFVMFSDSMSAINIAQSKVQVINKYSKHISRRVHWFRELLRSNPPVMCLRFVKGTDNLADMFTKCLPKSTFRVFKNRLLRGGCHLLRSVSTSFLSVSEVAGFFDRMLRIGPG
jgi:hypothetical protein